MLYKAELTYDELMLIDGKCNSTVQSVIDIAKQHEQIRVTLDGVSDGIKDFCAKLVSEATKNGELKYTRRNLRSCQVCKKQAGYETYKRSSRYHKKGDKNYDKSLCFYGYDFKQSFLIVQGYSSLGICNKCWENIQPILVSVLKDVKAEIAESITGEKPQYKKVPIRHCKKCDWTGLETKMSKARTLMNDGYYPSICPECKAENKPFGATYIESTGKWQVIDHGYTNSSI